MSQRKNENLDLGHRTVSRQNTSDIVSLPKTFVNNFLKESRVVRMSLTAEGNLILTPVKQNKKEEDAS
jgi:hypothetical protein